MIDAQLERNLSDHRQMVFHILRVWTTCVYRARARIDPSVAKGPQ